MKNPWVLCYAVKLQMYGVVDQWVRCAVALPSAETANSVKQSYMALDGVVGECFVANLAVESAAINEWLAAPCQMNGVVISDEETDDDDTYTDQAPL